MYTLESMRGELARIYRQQDGFIWAPEGESKDATLDEIVRYCWTGYEKALTAKGPQVIGRISDIHMSLQVKIANITKGQTLHDSSTHGNILKMDRWCLVMNDCWLLGGVHRRATFELMSQPTWQNVWNPTVGGFIVTIREVIGLEHFGYVREAGRSLGPGSQAAASYTCRNPSAAMVADLEAYHLAVALRESRGPMGAVEFIGAPATATASGASIAAKGVTSSAIGAPGLPSRAAR